MSYMHAPCANCPFLRKGGVRLMSGRVKDITRGLLSNPGRTFACHKTTAPDPDDDSEMTETAKSQHCGGALIFAEKNGNATQMMRIAERLGLYKPEKLKGKELVFDTVAEMLTTALDYKKPKRTRKKPEPRDPCHVADGECEAPAGWMSGGSIIEGTEGAEFDCFECGQPVCAACSTVVKRKRVCNEVRGGSGERCCVAPPDQTRRCTIPRPGIRRASGRGSTTSGSAANTGAGSPRSRAR